MFFSSILLASSLAAETQCLTRIIYHEARGESYSGRISVGLVVKNRVISPHFPNTICGVESQPNQFSYVHSIGDHGMYEEDSREASYEAAQAVLSTPPWPSIHNALFYHTTAVKPSWDYTKLDERAIIGNHVFYSCINDERC